MLNNIAFFAMFIAWAILLFKVLDKGRYGVLWYPATFVLLFLFGNICHIA